MGAWLCRALSETRRGTDNEATQLVVQRFTADCYRPSPTPALARELDRLCTCSIARIRASHISFADSEDAINAKVLAATAACYQEETARRRRRR